MKRELSDFQPLRPAETEYVEKLASENWGAGFTVTIGNGRLPSPGDTARTLRADFVRFLILGGGQGAEPPEAGLRLRGGLIEGELNLEGCRGLRDIGLLDCQFDAAPVLRGAEFNNVTFNRSVLPGLKADGLETHGGLVLRAVKIHGETRLIGARLGHELSCDGATFERPDGEALSAGGIDIRGYVFLRNATIRGEASFVGASIGRDLKCDETTFDRPGGSALAADGLKCGGSVFLLGADIRGEARFVDARLGGTLNCHGASFEQPDGYALAADRLEARGDVFLREARVRGEVRFLGAKLGGNLSSEGATFERADGYALSTDGFETHGGVFLQNATVRGEARFLGASIRTHVACDGATFERRGGTALNFDGATVGGTLFLRRGDSGRAARVDGVLDLTAATFGAICDEKGSWPTRTGDLRLNRCVYGDFTEAPVDADTRLEWLELQSPPSAGEDFKPQPYEQLAKVLRETGHAEGARQVLIAKEAKQRAARRARAGWPLNWWHGFWDQVLRVTVRYGRVPLLAFAWLFGLWVLGAAVFHDAARAGAMKPNNAFVLRAPEWAFCARPARPEVFADAAAFAARGRAAPGEGQADCFARQVEAASFPRLNVWAYSADALFPLVDLEMQDHWIPDATHPWPYADATRVYLWSHIALGWALSLLAVAGLSGIVRSD